MRARRRNSAYPSLLIPILIGGAIIFIVGDALDSRGRWPLEWSPGWVGEHRAVQLVFTPTSLQVRLGWGWSSRYWISQKDWYDSAGPREIGHECLGFVLGYRGGDFGGSAIRIRWLILGIPWWFPVALLLAPSLQRWDHRSRMRRRRKIRRARRCCPKCGYDLRASPDRCPECGTPTAKGAVIRLRDVKGQVP